MQLEVRLLGDVAVLADGHPLDLAGTRQRSVLAVLVLNRNRAIATELLADRLWPDEQPLTAIKTIQVYVSRIRRGLGPAAGRLTSSATGYSLAVADDELDAARFERGLRQAREALAAGSSETSLATLEAIIGLWSGPALGDLAGEQFARREADRLEELRLQALEELYELRIAAGQAREAIGDVRRLVSEEPGRERLWRLLMLALYADGRQGEALEAYQDARRYLADELGLDPSPELQELERAILTQEAPRPGAVALRSLPAVEEAAAAEPVVRRSRRVVTVLRTDVVRPSADGLDPELIEAHDRRALDVVRRAVERHGGTINMADQDGCDRRVRVDGCPRGRCIASRSGGQRTAGRFGWSKSRSASASRPARSWLERTVRRVRHSPARRFSSPPAWLPAPRRMRCCWRPRPTESSVQLRRPSLRHRLARMRRPARQPFA